MMANAILLISCIDQKGITAAVTNFIYENAGNIEHADQHIDKETDTFFMRIEWALDGFKIEKNTIAKQFQSIADRFEMKWSLYFTDDRPKVALFVSSHLHCLYDLLWRHKAGQFPCEIAMIVSNHCDAKEAANSFGIPFHEYPVTKSNKSAQEKRQLYLLKREKIETIILARYGQIFTKNFVSQFPNRIINIHHSFLPAFKGEKPYLQAYKKGVKIIGATSHYVIENLDEGPIIEQDTVRISHRDRVEGLKLKGEDLEKSVLARAVRWHLERKILVYNNKTVIFD